MLDKLAAIEAKYSQIEARRAAPEHFCKPRIPCAPKKKRSPFSQHSSPLAGELSRSARLRGAYYLLFSFHIFSFPLNSPFINSKGRSPPLDGQILRRRNFR